MLTNLTAEARTFDATGKTITPGFTDTHRRTFTCASDPNKTYFQARVKLTTIRTITDSWQTAFKTLGSNINLVEYQLRYAGPYWTPEDVYISQLTGLYEAEALEQLASLQFSTTRTTPGAPHTPKLACAAAWTRAHECTVSGLSHGSFTLPQAG